MSGDRGGWIWTHHLDEMAVGLFALAIYGSWMHYSVQRDKHRFPHVKPVSKQPAPNVQYSYISLMLGCHTYRLPTVLVNIMPVNMNNIAIKVPFQLAVYMIPRAHLYTITLW